MAQGAGRSTGAGNRPILTDFGEGIMAQVIINGRAYGLRFDLSAQERVEEEFGDLKAAFERMKNKTDREALGAVKKMFVIMANCERDYRGEPEDITEEALKHAPLSVISQLGDAIVTAIQDSMRVETVNSGPADDEVHDGFLEELDAKNGKTGGLRGPGSITGTR
jgi:hypothetical protein